MIRCKWCEDNGIVQAYHDYEAAAAFDEEKSQQILEIPQMIKSRRKIEAVIQNAGSFKYLGAITMYSYLQACGIINDHAKDCFMYDQLIKEYPVVHRMCEGEA